jgi:hypothetical protein
LMLWLSVVLLLKALRDLVYHCASQEHQIGRLKYLMFER